MRMRSGSSKARYFPNQARVGLNSSREFVADAYKVYCCRCRGVSLTGVLTCSSVTPVDGAALRPDFGAVVFFGFALRPFAGFAAPQWGHSFRAGW